MIYLVRSAWTGCTILTLEVGKTGGAECIDKDEYVPGLKPEYIRPHAGFVLTNPKDRRYKTVTSLRERFGRLLHSAFISVSQTAPPEGDAADSVDAIVQLLRGSDVWFFDYGVQRDTFVAHKKHFVMTRELVKTHSKQRLFPRMIWIKRATLYHYSRLYQHTFNRERSALDDQLLHDLLELCMSPYVRVRKHAQSTLISATGLYRRATRLIIPKLIEALEQEVAKGKDADPDRQKGQTSRRLIVGTVTEYLSHRSIACLARQRHRDFLPQSYVRQANEPLLGADVLSLYSLPTGVHHGCVTLPAPREGGLPRPSCC